MNQKDKLTPVLINGCKCCKDSNNGISLPECPLRWACCCDCDYFEEESDTDGLDWCGKFRTYTTSGHSACSSFKD